MKKIALCFAALTGLFLSPPSYSAWKVGDRVRVRGILTHPVEARIIKAQENQVQIERQEGESSVKEWVSISNLIPIGLSSTSPQDPCASSSVSSIPSNQAVSLSAHSLSTVHALQTSHSETSEKRPRSPTESFVENKTKISKTGNSPRSIYTDSLENTNLSKGLLEIGPNPGPDDNDSGKAPLHIAVENDDLIKVKNLLENGANPNEVDTTGATPLHFAAMSGHTEIIKLLIKKGANVNHADNEDMTPLHFAAWNGHTEAVRELQKNKAEPNVVDGHDWTPLRFAAESGHISTLKILLEMGANPRKVDKNGKTVLEYVTKESAAARILRKWLATTGKD